MMREINKLKKGDKLFVATVKSFKKKFLYFKQEKKTQNKTA